MDPWSEEQWRCRPQFACFGDVVIVVDSETKFQTVEEICERLRVEPDAVRTIVNERFALLRDKFKDTPGPPNKDIFFYREVSRGLLYNVCEFFPYKLPRKPRGKPRPMPPIAGVYGGPFRDVDE